MKNKITLCLCMLLMAFIHSNAQVKIGDNPNTVNSNSLLELESTTKGFLPPRMALNSLSTVAPLTGTVPAGMLIYSTGGTVTDGYYYWDGSRWVALSGGIAPNNVVTKTANATITKTETMVFAKNNITLTLPAITSSNNGLTITVKNIGNHTDLVTLVASGSAVMDSLTSIPVAPFFSFTFVANDGNWNVKERTSLSINTLEVSWASGWKSIKDAMEFLEAHMWGPAVIKMGSGAFNITETQVINLPYPLTIEGTSFGTTTLNAATGLTGKPMFRCVTETYFKMLTFDGSTLASYGTQSGEDGIRLVGTGTYNEIKDCEFNTFNKAIVDSTDAELWLFEADIINAVVSGIEMTGAGSDAIVKMSEVDFTSCTNGVNLVKGSNATVSITNCGFYNAQSGDIGIKYVPATFAPFSSIFITNNTWNNTGTYLSGFDFTRSDGRDANAFIENNLGMESKNAHCKINVNNNTSTVTVTPSGTWKKASWTNTSSSTVNWAISDNKITYQPTNVRDAVMIITGDLVNNNAFTVSVAIVKNGVTTTRYGECDLRITSANQAFQFATVIYVDDVRPGDYFELYFTSSHNNDVVSFQDIHWYTEAK